MPTILEDLKLRLAAAQARHAVAQQKLQVAQVEFNSATAEVNIWNNAVMIETRDESARAAEAAKDQIPIDLPSEATVEAAVSDAEQIEVQPEEDEEPVNKTEAVREILRQNPGGMTPAALWAAFQQQAPNTRRNYLYSVLKRLRDYEEVAQRRGKYVLKVKPPTNEEKGGLFVN
jgi:uncharacterized protein HemX